MILAVSGVLVPLLFSLLVPVIVISVVPAPIASCSYPASSWQLLTAVVGGAVVVAIAVSSLLFIVCHPAPVDVITIVGGRRPTTPQAVACSGGCHWW